MRADQFCSFSGAVLQDVLYVTAQVSHRKRSMQGPDVLPPQRAEDQSQRSCPAVAHGNTPMSLDPSNVNEAIAAVQSALQEQLRSANEEGLANGGEERNQLALNTQSSTDGLDTHDEDDEDESGDEEAEDQGGFLRTSFEVKRYAVRDDAAKSAFENESQVLLLMQVNSKGEYFMRTDLSRIDLLAACRNDIAAVGEEKVATSSSSSSSPSRDYLSSCANLHLRDLRRLTGFQGHAIMARRGAIVLALGFLNAVITHSNAYIVIPDGTDHLLQPFLVRLNKGTQDSSLDIPFEFKVVEAILLTLVTYHSEGVQTCVNEKHSIAEGLRKTIGSKMLTRIWKLKRYLSQLHEDIAGCERSIEEVQDDPDALALMYLSAMHEDPGTYEALLRARKGNTEHVQLLLDTYELEFHALSSQLLLIDKEVKLALARPQLKGLSQIEGTEDLLTLQLDVARNNLWKVLPPPLAPPPQLQLLSLLLSCFSSSSPRL
eukprot:490669-Hanusia_phi.AAC.1